MSAQIKQLLNGPPSLGIGLILKDAKDATLAAKSFESRIVPIMQISCKTGEGLELFVGLLNCLPPHNNWQLLTDGSAVVWGRTHGQFHISHTELAPNEPPLLWGIVYKGTIRLRQRMFLGPDKEGVFRYLWTRG